MDNRVDIACFQPCSGTSSLNTTRMFFDHTVNLYRMRLHFAHESTSGEALDSIYPVTWSAMQVRYAYDNKSVAFNAVDQPVGKPR
jgi:hypothetical protein